MTMLPTTSSRTASTPEPTSGSRIGAVSALPFALSLALMLGACGGDIGEPTTIEVDEGAGIDGTSEAIAPLSDAVAPPTELEPVADAAPDDVLPDAAPDVAPDGAPDVAMSDAPSDGWEVLQDDWASAVPDVQARFGELSEEELLATGGDREQLVMIVQEKYNLELEEAERQVTDFEATL